MYQRRESSSPLRQNNRVISQHNNINEQQVHSKHSAEKFTISRHNESHLQNPPLVTNSKNNEYIQQLYSDNSQLKRRLELVAAELDRVTREKTQHFDKYQSMLTQTQYYQKSLRGEADQETEALHANIYVSREENKRMQHHLNESDFTRQEIISKLKLLKNERDRLVHNSEELTAGLQHKVAVTKDLECDICFCQQKIQEVVGQIQLFERQLKEDNLRAHDIQIVIDRLYREREDLNQKMHHLTQNYDRAVADISRERAQIESHNKRHIQILTSKALFQSLETMLLNRKQLVINEFFNYCKFDQNCHKVLKQFSGVLFKCGQYQMKIGLNTWFRNTYQPPKLGKQNYKLSALHYDNKLKQRTFSRFRATLNQKETAQGNVEIAVQKLWRFKVKDVQRDVRRSLQIWRDHTHLNSQRIIRLKFLLMRQRNNLRRQALMNWRSFSMQLDFAIRRHILSTEFASDQQKLIILNSMRGGILQMKELRRSRLAKLMKAWRDSISYRRYMMAQAVQAGHLRKSLDQKLAASCFYALRTHKEQEKYELLLTNLEGDCQPQMLQLQQSIEQLCDEEFKQRKLRSLTCLSSHFLTYLASYFNHWKRQKVSQEFRIKNNLRQIIVRRYLNQIHRAFDAWLTGFQFSKRIYQQSQIENLAEEGQNLRTQNFSLARTVQEEKNRQDKNARTGLTRATNILKRRMLQFGLGRWSEQCSRLTLMEEKAALIIKKKRKNLCFQAISVYKKFTKSSQQADFDEARMLFQSNTLAQRRVRQIFNAFYRYVQEYSKARNSFGVLVNKMEIWLQRRTFKRWIEQGNLKTEQRLCQTQNLETSRFDQLNQNYGILVNTLNEASSENTEIKSQLKRQGQRILANVFARFYYSSEARGFRKWHQVVINQRHLEDLVKRAVNQNRRRMFYFSKSLIKNFISRCKIAETKDRIKQTLLDTSNTIQQTQFNRTQFEEQQNLRAAMTERVLQKLQKLHQRGNWTVLMIQKLNQHNYYQSKLRFIFNCWSDFTKRQIKFCIAIEKVISKSLWQNGFDNINAYSRDKKLTRHQNVALRDMIRLFQRKNLERVIGLFKTKTFNNIRALNKATNEATQENVYQQKRLVDHQYQDQRVKTGSTVIQTDQRKNLLRAWANTVKFLKHIRASNQYQQELEQNLLQKQAIRKWYQRAKNTAKCRGLQHKFRQRQRILILGSLYTGWSHQYQQDKKFSILLSNIAAKFDTKSKQTAMQMMKGFAKSRLSTNELDKKVASLKLYNSLSHLHYRKMTDYLSELRVRVVSQKLKDLVISSMFGHWHARDLRKRFMHWRNQAKQATTVIEVNEIGPVVEEVLEAQQDWSNLTNFMRDQGYTEKEVEQFREKAQQYSQGLLKKTVARMKHFSDDKYLKPKMFERWKQFVHMRKLLRYLLRNMENKLKPVKADLSIAFNRWKFRVVQKNDELDGIDRSILIRDLTRKQERIEKLNQLETDAGSYIYTLGIQREELIENYLRSQRLAIAVGRDNLERGVQKGFSAMADHSHFQKRFNFEAILQRNISLISSLKQKITDFEFDNQELANENQELRQFSLDGYQIAKGVQSLSDERERLSVDLADKATTIKSLLDENEVLSIKLKQAQDAAVALIQQSNVNIQRMQMGNASLRH